MTILEVHHYGDSGLPPQADGAAPGPAAEVKKVPYPVDEGTGIRRKDAYDVDFS